MILRLIGIADDSNHSKRPVVFPCWGGGGGEWGVQRLLKVVKPACLSHGDPAVVLGLLQEAKPLPQCHDPKRDQLF